jgi:hypothetical protein
MITAFNSNDRNTCPSAYLPQKCNKHAVLQQKDTDAVSMEFGIGFLNIGIYFEGRIRAPEKSSAPFYLTRVEQNPGSHVYTLK